MSSFLDLATTPLLLALCVLAGAAMPGKISGTLATRTTSFRFAMCAVVGLVMLHGWMLLLDLLGIEWRRLTVIAPLALAAGVGVLRLRSSNRGQRSPASHWPAWGDLLVLGALGGFAVLLLRPCLTMPDVVFHWGIKTQRSVLAGGIDYAFMQQPWNFNKHADYPFGVPNLYTAGAILRGRYSEITFLPWTLAYVALLAAGTREAFAGRRDFAAQATLVIVVFVTTAFAIGHLLGGSPDLLMAAILVAAMPAILATVDAGSWTATADRRAAQVGWLAALAVSAKYEGGPLAVLLVLACLWQRRRMRLAVLGASLWLLVVPGLAVAGIWWQQVWRLGLAQGNRAGAFDPSRARAIGEGALQALNHPSWQGFSWVVLALPALLLVGWIRPMVAVVVAQLGVYAWVYFATPLDVANLMATSAERLLVHVVPATLALGGLALAGQRQAVLAPGDTAPGDSAPDERAQRPRAR